ncbi:MAG: alanyl-tRNA editing protein, partial [Roseiflexaceae bacterium]
MDRTALYATAGGQPHDTGTLSAGERSWQVAEVRREGDHVWHTL